MNTNRSQNRALAIVGIVAIVLGLGVGLLWAGVGSTAPSNPSASNQTTAPTAAATATPGNDATIPTVVTSNTGEAATSSDNNANSSQPTPTASSASADNGNSASGNTTTGAASPTPNSSDVGNTAGEATGGNATINGDATSTPTNGKAQPKRRKTPAAPNTGPSRTPVPSNLAANGKGKGKGNVAVSNGNQVAVGGVVDHVDAPNKLVVLDTSFGPLTATLATTATIQRQPLPGDSPSVKIGPISLSDVQVGSYATVLVRRDQLPKPSNNTPPKQQNGTPTPSGTPGTNGTPTPSGTPAANDQNNSATQAKNRETLLKRKFGVGDGFSATVSALRVGPAPASIEQADGNRLLGVRATPATFVALDSDGNIIATITQYGNIRVIVGPGTRFDRLGQPISATDLKPGDSIILYGASVWVGTSGDTTMTGANAQGKNGGNPAGLPTVAAGKGTGKGKYANGLPITDHIASLHVVTTNEHVLQGKLTAVNTSANTFQIGTTTNETFTVNVAADTKYQSLVAAQSVSSLADLKPGSYAVVYTIGDSDIDPKVYNAKTVDILPAAR